MERVKSFLSRPRNVVLVVALIVGVAGGATYAAAGRSEKNGSGDNRIIIHHVTGQPVLTPKQIGAGTRQGAVANVLDADVKVGEFYGDMLTYTGISAERLAQYSAAFDPSQFTVVATHGGHDFYVCSRSGKWYAEQAGVHRSPVATKTPGPLCKL